MHLFCALYFATAAVTIHLQVAVSDHRNFILTCVLYVLVEKDSYSYGFDKSGRLVIIMDFVQKQHKSKSAGYFSLKKV